MFCQHHPLSQQNLYLTGNLLAFDIFVSSWNYIGDWSMELGLSLQKVGGTLLNSGMHLLRKAINVLKRRFVFHAKPVKIVYFTMLQQWNSTFAIKSRGLILAMSLWISPADNLRLAHVGPAFLFFIFNLNPSRTHALPRIGSSS